MLATTAGVAAHAGCLGPLACQPPARAGPPRRRRPPARWPEQQRLAGRRPHGPTGPETCPGLHGTGLSRAYEGGRLPWGRGSRSLVGAARTCDVCPTLPTEGFPVPVFGAPPGDLRSDHRRGRETRAELSSIWHNSQLEDVSIRACANPGHPRSASNMTPWVNRQFPRPDGCGLPTTGGFMTCRFPHK